MALSACCIAAFNEAGTSGAAIANAGVFVLSFIYCSFSWIGTAKSICGDHRHTFGFFCGAALEVRRDRSDESWGANLAQKEASR
jgi:hypothetical protein